jgi:hypothetical protein
MPQNPQKTKGEILSELESIKGLLLEEDDIPILQEVDHHHHPEGLKNTPRDLPKKPAQAGGTQTSIFDEIEDIPVITDLATGDSHNHNHAMPKAAGENPFLPQHIRERLHGNNPPPLFDFDLSQKTTTTLKSKTHIDNRHDLVNDLVKRYLPQIEQELRLKLLAMTEEELKKL